MSRPFSLLGIPQAGPIHTSSANACVSRSPCASAPKRAAFAILHTRDRRVVAVQRHAGEHVAVRLPFHHLQALPVLRSRFAAFRLLPLQTVRAHQPKVVLARIESFDVDLAAVGREVQDRREIESLVVAVVAIAKRGEAVDGSAFVAADPQVLVVDEQCGTVIADVGKILRRSPRPA